MPAQPIREQAKNMLRTIRAEERKQERLEQKAAESADYVQALRAEYLRENRNELYCFIAAEFLQHYKKFIPDLTRMSKKQLREFIRHLPYPTENGSYFVSKTSRRGANVETNYDPEFTADKPVPQVAEPEGGVSPRQGECAASPLLEQALQEPTVSGSDVVACIQEPVREQEVASQGHLGERQTD